jgi:glycosyltransferase involved in cell wall biosynthesis
VLASHSLNAGSPHIGLNLIYLRPGETGGMEVYARELIPALVAAAPGLRFTAFINRETARAGEGPWLELIRTVTVPVNASDRVQWMLGEQVLLPRLAARASVDLMHSLGVTAPVWGRFYRVATVHDLTYLHHPETHEGIRARVLRLLVPLAVRRSDRLIPPSEFTRRDLIEILRTPAERIDVVPHSPRTLRREEPMPESEVRSRFELGDRRVVLSVSAKRPHKNLAALIGALALIPADRRPVLVLPGYPTWYEGELRARASELGVAEDVRLLGWLPDRELEGLWRLAQLFVFPSLSEGFGLPPLEAMARGVPVVCSNAGSLPEVVGEAALLFDPRDEAAMAAALERLLSDENEAQRLARAGKARVAEFTWERTARLTLQSYARTLGLEDVPSSWTSL